MLVREKADTLDLYKRAVLQMEYGLCSEEVRIITQIQQTENL